MTYTPDIKAYQQLEEPHTGAFDCTAYCGAILVDATTVGAHKVTGRQVRLHSDEPTPDPSSPGLNLHQVDDSTRALAPVNFDTETGYGIVAAQKKIIDGRWAAVQVNRGILVNAGYAGGNDFRGGHCVTVHYVNGAAVLGDPLVPFYQRVGWATLWNAAASLVTGPDGHHVGPGRANVMFTRDLIPDWAVTIHPSTAPVRRGFNAFTLSPDGKRIATRHRHYTLKPITGSCTVPKFYPWPNHVGRTLVQITSGTYKGWWVRDVYAHEVK